ncbi:hypothetical protein DIS24_g4726 [Lasiodiplodia hormozganensis]|uniref:Uncharacterized protein n=1 Tax=Lasiodiplodia hormozganensis TaxID=869390 RepID=A0AA39YTT7_9PEZI|nr:hypothetical protein DIS24_g4726 [Lasiodiplodia hormozganensis]
MSAEPPGFIHVVDPSYFDSDPIEPFRLLDLPRELRDVIYEHMVVRGTVYIIPGDCWKPEQEKRDGHPRAWQLHTRQVRRTTYLRTTHAPGGYYSYHDPHYTDVERVNVSIFLVNKQVYHEASAIYYKKNTFYFGNAGPCDEILSVPACYAFLVDRTPDALRKLKAITIMIDSQGVNSPTGSWLDGEYMFDLIDFINKNLALETFGLDLCGWPPDVRLSTWNWSVPHPRHWTHGHRMSWIGALLQLNKVEKLSIEIVAADGNPERLAAFVCLLRHHLLENGERLGTRNIKTYARHFGRYCSLKESGHGDAELYYKRKTVGRRLQLLSHDDANGRSFVPPATRMSPLWEGAVAKRVAKGQELEEARKQVREEAGNSRYTSVYLFPGEEDSDVSDYDASDGGDNDSLNSVELDEDDMGFVRDEDYFETFRDLDDRRRHANARRYRIGGQVHADSAVEEDGSA